MVALALFLITGCTHRPDSRPRSSDLERGVRVVSIDPTSIDPSSSAQENAAALCRSWKLSAAQAERFFALSEQIGPRTFVHTYDTAPCKVSGTVEMDGRAQPFEINGASKARVGSGDTARLYGCDVQACEPLVMWIPGSMDED